MALNLGGNKGKPEGDNARNVVLGQAAKDRENVKISSMDQFQRARMELMSDFVQDMSDTALDNSVSEEELLASEKRYKQLRTKRNVLFATLVGTLALLVVFGFVNTFLSKDITPEEIAYYSNYYNGRTNFPQDGVQGFLTTNVPAIMIGHMKTDGNSGQVDVKNVMLSKISPLDNTSANVYFYAIVATATGETRVNCETVLTWDANNWQYTLSDDIAITPMRSVDRNPNIGENKYWSFEDIRLVESDQSNSAETFVDNLFAMMYSGRDISPYYSGPQVFAGNVSYVKMVDFKMYTQANAVGYNTVATIDVSFNGTGVIYTTKKYMNLVLKDGNWTVTRMV